MAFDSQMTNPSSSMVGTSALGFSWRYCGVSTTPNGPPASMRLYPRFISSQHQRTFWTFTEFFRPQITTMHSSAKLRVVYSGWNDRAHWAAIVAGAPGAGTVLA